MNRRFLFGSMGLWLIAAPPLMAQPPVATGSKPRDATIKYDVKNGYNLAFVDADVRRVIDAVLGSMLELDYAVDPAVTGNITLRTSQPVARESLIPLLESALNSVNAVVVVEGKSYRVLPRAAARNRAPLPVPEGDKAVTTQGFATEVVTLKNGSAREIGRILEQFLGKDIVTVSQNALNQLVISGTGEERESARQLIARFDIDTLADMSFEIYKLENVDAETLLIELQRIFQPPFDIIGSRVRIIPLPRLRSMMVIAAERSDIARVEPWIRRLDAGVAGKRKLYHYSVQNGRAREMASSLQMVLSAAGGGGSSSAESFVPAAPLSGESAVGAGEAARPTPTVSVSVSTPVFESGGAGPRIVPNDQNNSLLIYANGEEYEFVRDALDKLDQPVSQVLIEATLAEVTLSNDFRFGVNFAGVSGNTSAANSSSGSGTPSASFPGFSLSVIGSSAQAVLNTLQSKTTVRVLSAPKLIVLNNQTASLQVGDQVPIVTQQAQSVAAPGAPIVNTIELRDTGVILKVTPRVNDSGTITMDISQEVSDVAETTTSGINSPTIQQRKLSSTVSTRTGQMIALGGLIRERRSEGRSGIPLLSQIPVVGGLFGRQSITGARTELIILITPTIIRSPDQVKGIVDALIDGLDSTRPLIERARERQVGGKVINP